MKDRKDKVLFIEDAKLTQRALKQYLGQGDFPYDCLMVTSVGAAENILAEEKFDVVVMDYLPEDGSAFDLVKKTKDTPLIIITSAEDQEIAVRAVQEGAYDYLIKDFDGNYLKVLPITVENAIHQKKSKEKLISCNNEHQEKVIQPPVDSEKKTAQPKRADEDIRLLAEFLLENPNPVLRIKNDGTIQFANRASKPILDAWKREIGQNIPDKWRQLIRETYNSQRSAEVEFSHETQVLSLTITPFPGTDYLYCHGLDITEHKRAEMDLVKDRRLLEEMVDIRTAEQEVTERKRAEESIKRSREKLRNLSAHLESVREDERMRIAREIHDELGQLLTALQTDLSYLIIKLPEANELLIKRTKKMSKLIEKSIQTVQRISSDLRPPVLDELGIVPAIEWHAEEFQARTGIKCKVSFNTEDIVMDKDRSTVIYRIFQEALTNVARHANATIVNTSMKKGGGKLILKIKDNGSGISEEELSSMKSFGIIGIKERACFVGGEAKIEGIKGKGTAITVKIPLSRKEDAE
jgi:signal transduction histidine kinase/DNA-binding response OmpR family regulator